MKLFHQVDDLIFLIIKALAIVSTSKGFFDLGVLKARSIPICRVTVKNVIHSLLCLRRCLENKSVIFS